MATAMAPLGTLVPWLYAALSRKGFRSPPAYGGQHNLDSSHLL